MKKDLITIQEAAKLLGVSSKTLRRWDKSGIIVPFRTAGNQRRYNISAIEHLKKTKRKLTPSFQEIIQDKNQETRIQETNKSQVPNPLESKAPYKDDPDHSWTHVQVQQKNVQVSHDVQDDPLGPWYRPKSQRHSFYRSNLLARTFLLILVALTTGALTVMVFGAGVFSPLLQQKKGTTVSSNLENILGSESELKKLKGEISFNIKTILNNNLLANGDALFTKDATVEGSLTAPNIVYSVVGGQNITVSGDPQNPTISTGPIVSSLGGKTGDLKLDAGSGISISGLTITNTGVTSFGGTTGAVTLTNGTGISVSGTTINNTGVTSITGTANQIIVSGSTGAVTLSTPQDIDKGATPIFSTLNLTSDTNEIVLGSTNTGTITLGTLTAARTYTLPDLVTSNDNFCLQTLGNCSGGASGIGGSGTVNRVAKFTGVNTIGNSSINDLGSTVAMTILANGNVGIGTTAPGTKLEVNGTIGFTGGGVTLDTSNLTYGNPFNITPASTVAKITAQVAWGAAQTGDLSTWGLHAASNISSGTVSPFVINPDFSGQTATAGYTAFKVNPTDGAGSGTKLIADFQIGGVSKLALTNAGNVGIGTTSPGTKLEIVSGGGESIRLSGSGTNSNSLRVVNTGNDVYFGSEGSAAGGFFTGSLAYSSVIYSSTAIQNIIGGTSRMIITTAGNVGIGTTAPGGTLELGQAVTATTGSTYYQSKFNNTYTGTMSSSTPITSIYGIYNRPNVGIGGTSPQLTNLFLSYLQGNIGIGTTTAVTNLYGEYIAAPTLNSNSSVTNKYALVTESGAGNVGIGTTNPTSKLLVVDSIADSVISVKNTLSSGYSNISFLDNTGALKGSVGYANASAANFAGNMQMDSFGDIALGTFSVENVRIKSGGNVGIGTTNPGNKLEVNGSFQTSGGSFNIMDGGVLDSTAVRLTTNSGNLYIQNGSGDNTIFRNKTGGEYARFINAGNLGIGDTNPANTLKIVGSLCVKNAQGTCAGTTSGTIYATNQTVQAADLAENYISSQSLEPGDLVIPAQDGDSQAIIKSTSTYQQQSIGVISTNPGVTMNSDATTDSTHPNLYPVALQGRVPVKVTTENGNIQAGDNLTTSSTPGVAMKATHAGQIIGKALEPFSQDGIGKILTFVNISYADPNNVLANLKLDENGALVLPSDTKVAQKVILGSETTPESTDSGQARVTGESLNDLIARVSSLENKDSIASSSSGLTASESAMLKDRVDLLEKDVDILKGQVLAASVSATLNQATDSAYLNASSEAVLEKLTVTGSTNVNDLGVTGTITAGTIAIDGLNGEVNTLGGPLKLQTLALEGIEFVGKKVEIDRDGNVAINEGNLEIKRGRIIGNDNIRGIDIPIATGQTQLTVSFPDPRPTPAYAVTVTPAWLTQVAVTNKTVNGFTVKFLTPAPTGATLDWVTID